MTMSRRRRIARPAQMSAGGRANAPADREVRYKPYNAERENKN